MLGLGAKGGTRRRSSGWWAAAPALLFAAACASPLPGRPYPCHPGGSADECPGGWRCGLDGTCHDPAVASDYLCASDSDCELGWHCGVLGRCYDRADAGEIACRKAVDSDPQARDCAPGWTCASESLCHDLDASVPYACASDSDCGHGWRCSLDRTCVDASGDALRPDAYPGAFDISRVSPALLSAPPDHVAAAPLGTGYGYAFSVGPEWAYVYQHPSGMASQDGGWAYALVARGRLASPVTDVGVSSGGGWMAGIAAAPGELATLEFPQGGGALADAGAPGPASFDALHSGFGDGTEAITHDARTFTIHWRDGTSWQPMTVSYDGGGDLLIHDIVAPRYSWLVAATDQGLFAGYWSWEDDGGIRPPDWQPQTLGILPNAACSASLDGGYEVRSLAPGSSGDPTAALAVPFGSRDAGLVLIGLSSADDPPSPGCPDPPYWSMSSVALPACAPCPDGQRFLAFGRTVWESDPRRYVFEVVCGQDGDAGVQRRLYRLSPSASGACVRQRQLGSSTFYSDWVLAQRGSGMATGHAGAHAQLWAAGMNDEPPMSLTLDQVPTAASTADGRLETFAGASSQVLEPEVGLVTRTAPAELYGVELVSAFGEREDLALSYQSVYDWVAMALRDRLEVRTWPRGSPPSSDLVASTEAAPNSLRPPHRGASLSLADGGTLLVVSAYDALFSAELAGPDAGVPLVIRSVPSPLSPIQALAADRRPDAGTAVYALAKNGLYRVAVPAMNHWVAARVDLPPGDWVSVWEDGARGRIGYRDGVVYSLPSRVVLAGSLDAGADAVQDYAAYCGQSFALTRGGLYRLAREAGGGPVGLWTRVPIEAAAGASPDYVGGRLAIAGGALYAFTAQGVAIRVSRGGCP